MDSTADLYTGSNSGSFGNSRREQRATIVAEKRERKAFLTPAYTIVKEIIDKESAKIKDIEYLYVDGFIPDEQLNTELVARRKYLSFLKGLDAQLKQTLVESK
jgi:hypothetical protein